MVTNGTDILVQVLLCVWLFTVTVTEQNVRVLKP
jgi:hypothetical protein